VGKKLNVNEVADKKSESRRRRWKLWLRLECNIKLVLQNSLGGCGLDSTGLE
jgi:hypothetical protein